MKKLSHTCPDTLLGVITLLIMFSFSHSAYSQINLVSNCSFEDTVACPDNPAIRVRNYRGWDAAIIQEEEAKAEKKEPAAGKQASPPQDSALQKNPLPEKEKKKKTWKDDVYGE